MFGIGIEIGIGNLALPNPICKNECERRTLVNAVN
jgi:hypothetical protein